MPEPDNTQAIMRKFEPMLKDLTGQELVVLNQMVVERIRMIKKAASLMQLAKFNLGDYVTWNGSDGVVRKGIVIRLNIKTVSVKTEEEGHWKISPQLLRKV